MSAAASASPSAASRPGPPLSIQARGWSFRYAGRQTWAVRDLELTVEPGERVLLAGPSGGGKSTLLTGLAGLLDAEQAGDVEGALLVGGAPPARVRDRIGLAFQDPETQLVMARAGDDVAFGLENRAVPTERIWPRVDEALALTGFPYDRDHPTGRLSGGEKQRLVLAGVVALRPDLILLDEPTANLDPDGAALVRQAVDQVVAATGATLVVVDHRVGDWLPMVDRVVVLRAGGGVLADGTPEKVFAAGHGSLAAAGVWIPGEIPAPRRTAPSRPADLLTAQAVGYTYPAAERPALADADLRLSAGEVVAVTGANGSGKSTLAMLTAGLLSPSAGEVRVSPDLSSGLFPRLAAGRRRSGERRPLHRWRAAQLVRAVGTVFQDPEHQFLTASVRAELALGPRLAGLSRGDTGQRVDELLHRLALDHLADANPFTLSGGEKRRLSVGTALASGPRVLVLDEPTFGQDRRTWGELVDLLAELRDDGHAICCVSHDRDLISVLADREVRVRSGRVIG
ncbi:ABC transporter ATP-binding protein [Actinopolymorpha singaporensis]|uniref:Energy-coupling factor transport system ATP-binding protein n=1 Tax=Actinopolymorpha singaporensis TaxID=117157 RepID=A0A1H1X124_9ACTN|nr:ABC transporter ATP-binding protein [Actinopolymorpha singaporensis]SDT02998.1 energy-coupling factor transport system ATP-binding protein [Actinopolymorpha singaporensis]